MKTWFDNGFSLIKNTILIAIAILFMYENELKHKFVLSLVRSFVYISKTY